MGNMGGLLLITTMMIMAVINAGFCSITHRFGSYRICRLLCGRMCNLE